MTSTTSRLSRIFSADKLVESYGANLLGAQVFRTVAARLSHRRRAADIPDQLQLRLAELEQEGVYVWPDFLRQDLFKQLVCEFDESLSGKVGIRSFPNGPNNVSRASVRDLDRDAIPAMYKLLTDDRFQSIQDGAEHRKIGDLSSHGELELLTQGKSSPLSDPQTGLHSDIYFTSHKAWFYLTDVDLRIGPLAYVPRSHHLTLARLYRVYKHSCRRGPDVDSSRRVDGREMKSVSDKEIVLTCRRNTLVIANTCGYHRRLQGAEGSQRKSVHLELRANPFARSN